MGAGLCAGKASIERGVQHLVQVSSGDKVQLSSDVSRKLLQVLLVPLREDDPLHTGPMSGQDFVLDPAHLQRAAGSSRFNLSPVDLKLCGVTGLTGSTSPLRVISPVIAMSDLTKRPLNSEARQVTMVTPAEGPSLVTAPAGKWRWMSVPSRGSGAPTTLTNSRHQFNMQNMEFLKVPDQDLFYFLNGKTKILFTKSTFNPKNYSCIFVNLSFLSESTREH